MKSVIVFSGYLRCRVCGLEIVGRAHGGCTKCKRREFEYGVLNAGTFMSYQELKERVQQGHKFRDGTNSRKPITKSTFGIGHVTKRKSK